MQRNKIKPIINSNTIIKNGNFKLKLLLLSYFFILISYIIANIKNLLKYNYLLNEIVLLCFLFSIGFILTFIMIPPFMDMFLKKGKYGVDINKVENYMNKEDPNRKLIPECLGLVSSVSFLVVLILYVFLGQKLIRNNLRKTYTINNKLKSLEEINNSFLYDQQLASILISIVFMILLGFVDDILDLRWRYKLVLPAIASIPLVVAYPGYSAINLPKFLKFFNNVDSNPNVYILELGIVYKAYLSVISIFCTNAINIYAGINGLEVGQSIVIAISMLLYNVICLVNTNNDNNLNIELFNNNVDSIVILLLFLSCSLPLFYYNKYPSKCFIGDTYCYFSGITLACAAIVGKFEYTILLFFIPQILNFLLSLPQLIGIIECPRHRLPTYNSKTGFLYSKISQLNLLNQGLRLIGPKREQDLCTIALLFQGLCSAFGFIVRFYIYPKL